MTQHFVENITSTDGEFEGKHDEQQSVADTQHPISLWLKQHGIDDNVMSDLRQNGVNSLNDFKLLETEQDNEDIRDFVNCLEIKAFMTKEKLINAINQLQNETESKNDDETTQQNLKRKKILWQEIESKTENKETIKIQSKKSENIKLKHTHEQHKNSLSEKRRRYLWRYGKVDDGYFGGMANDIRESLSEKRLQYLWRYDKVDGGYFGGMANDIRESGEMDVLRIALMVDAVVLTIIPILPVYYGIVKYNQYQEDKNLSFKKDYNSQSKIFNDKLSEIKKLEKLISLKHNKLRKQEEKLNSHNFELERICGIHNKSRVVMVIGPTGFGKSLVSNRLLGNKKDIDTIEDSKTCDFHVGTTGNVESVTHKLTKKSKFVHIYNTGGKTEETLTFLLSVVDSPGAFDSKGNDNDYNNMMVHYFGACGGINAFAVFFCFGRKMDSKYKKLLTKYARFFGDGFWKKCCIFITHCDMDSKQRTNRVKRGLQTTKEQIQLSLKTLSKGKCVDVPMYMFGEKNFKESTLDFISSLMDTNSPFYHKYKCENIRSPIDALYEELQPKVKEHQEMVKDLQNISEIVQKAKDKIKK